MPFRVGILRVDDVNTELVDTFGEYPEMFEDLLQKANFSRPLEQQVELIFTTYYSNEGHLPETLSEQHAYIITGSKTGVYEDLAWIAELERFIQTLHKAKKIVVGICFGHQLIAQALGGLAAKAPQGWQIGVKTANLNQNNTNDYNGIAAFNLLYSHQDQVIKAAPGSLIVASTPDCPIAMTTLGNHILTFQGHPEFNKSYAQSLYEFRQAVYPQDRYNEAIRSLELSIDEIAVAQWMIDFITA
jgi:GMP synthase-like glutamine amidotransferase